MDNENGRWVKVGKRKKKEKEVYGINEGKE
jgi:hypothetical protein